MLAANDCLQDVYLIFNKVSEKILRPLVKKYNGIYIFVGRQLCVYLSEKMQLFKILQRQFLYLPSFQLRYPSLQH